MIRTQTAWAMTLLLLVAAPWLAEAQEVTLERLLSAPFPSEMTASPAGDRVAWVQNERGVRNVWVADGPGFQGRRLTAYADDDGQEVGSLAFTPDGSRLVYVRGGSPNALGEHPNPRTDPEGAERAIWVVGVGPGAAGEPARVDEGRDPAVSPDGERVAYLKSGVWIAPLDGSEEPRRLFDVRGGEGELRWSPDGSRLAFVSARSRHSFVGVHHLEDGTVTWMDPDIDRDSNPAWSPDGTRIAFIRIPYELELPYEADREGLPWSIRVADAATGEGREVWRAREGRGSAFQGVAADRQLWWGGGDRLVFPWEGEGWLHLYSVPAEGGEAVLLTPGDFEVEHVTPTPDRRALVYSSNQGDVDRRHLWRVPVRSGPPEPVTSGEGIEWGPAVTAGSGAVAYMASTAVLPARAMVRTADGEPRPMDPGSPPEGFPSGALVRPEAVTFPATDGMEIRGQLFLPPDLAPGERRPGVLFLHGGSRRQMLLGFHYRGYYHNAYALNQYLAHRGFVVLSVNYRSGTGYGLEFREALDYGARGASEFRDVLGAGLYLGSRGDVDPGRIGLWGGSYGGYLTALGLARASDLFAAGVDLHGVHDWNIEFAWDGRTLPDQLDELARVKELALESSPMAWVDGWESPVLFVHGDDDRNVPFRETVLLAEKLRRRGVEIETLVFPDEVHGFLLHRSWLRAYRAAAEFFERRLGR